MNATGPVMMPPGGIFTIKDETGVPITGGTRDELITKLTNTRVSNHRPVGDPARWVDQQMVGQVGFSSPIPITAIEEKPKPKERRLIDRVGSWLANRLGNVGQVTCISNADALKRAAICARCPKNKEWRGCVTCSQESIKTMNRNVVILSQNKETPLHNRLKACSVAGHENRVAVWLAEPFLKHRVNYVDQLPEFCWLKNL